jgi:hypothetical protein
MNTLNELLDYIFEGKQPALYANFEEWVRGSRRFKAFAISYRSKIRSKLKGVRDDAGLQDVRAELETAALLLREERFALEYEKYTALRQRGPDFTITFKTHTLVNIEVRRLRSVELEDDGDGSTEAHFAKLKAVLCDKVGQMPPSIINLLWLIAERDISEADITGALSALRYLAEAKDEIYFTRRGFKNSADFLKHYRQLSGIVVQQSGEPVIWLNPLTRHSAPTDLVNAIRRLING